MGSVSDPKDGKVVAGSILWAVLVYAVRRSSFPLSFGGRYPQLVLLSPPPPFRNTNSMPGVVVGKKQQDLILRVRELGFPRVLWASSNFTLQSE